jgi:hypothetical protein
LLSTPRPTALSLTRLIGLIEDARGELDSNGAGRLEIDDQLEPAMLRYGHLGRIAATQESIHVVCNEAEMFSPLYGIGIQTADLDEWPDEGDGRQSMNMGVTGPLRTRSSSAG